MVMFVFKMFDWDRDGYISKKDVFRHLMLERGKQMVYPNNNLRAVELFKCDRGDRINKKLFLKLVTDVPYLIFPAFRLQEDIIRVICGARFWTRIKQWVEDMELEKRKLRVELCKAPSAKLWGVYSGFFRAFFKAGGRQILEIKEKYIIKMSLCPLPPPGYDFVYTWSCHTLNLTNSVNKCNNW